MKMLRNALAAGLLLATLMPSVATAKSPAPSATPKTAAQPAGKTDPVFATPSGKKFHTATCKTMKGKGVSMSRADAEKKKLEACKVCKP